MKKLTNTKKCSECKWCTKNICEVDKHEVTYEEQAYSCKYYKK